MVAAMIIIIILTLALLGNHIIIIILLLGSLLWHQLFCFCVISHPGNAMQCNSMIYVFSVSVLATTRLICSLFLLAIGLETAFSHKNVGVNALFLPLDKNKQQVRTGK